ncbi:MAG: hypothetical protein WCK31_01220 [bacterium]
MFKFFYLTIFCIISFGILYYLIAIVLTPYDSQNILQINNLIIVDIVTIIATGSLIGLIHSFIDKLFVLKFYQKPRIFLGLRRGILISTTLVVMLNMKLFGFIDWYYFGLVALLGVLIEILLSSIKKKNIEEKKVD